MPSERKWKREADMARLTIYVDDAALAAARLAASAKGTTLQAMLRSHFAALAPSIDRSSRAALRKNRATDPLE
jgi:hypothetical protein